MKRCFCLLFIWLGALRLASLGDGLSSQRRFIEAKLDGNTVYYYSTTVDFPREPPFRVVVLREGTESFTRVYDTFHFVTPVAMCDFRWDIKNGHLFVTTVHGAPPRSAVGGNIFHFRFPLKEMGTGPHAQPVIQPQARTDEVGSRLRVGDDERYILPDFGSILSLGGVVGYDERRIDPTWDITAVDDIRIRFYYVLEKGQLISWTHALVSLDSLIHEGTFTNKSVIMSCPAVSWPSVLPNGQSAILSTEKEWIVIGNMKSADKTIRRFPKREGSRIPILLDDMRSLETFIVESDRCVCVGKDGTVQTNSLRVAPELVQLAASAIWETVGDFDPFARPDVALKAAERAAQNEKKRSELAVAENAWRAYLATELPSDVVEKEMLERLRNAQPGHLTDDVAIRLLVSERIAAKPEGLAELYRVCSNHLQNVWLDRKYVRSWSKHKDLLREAYVSCGHGDRVLGAFITCGILVELKEYPVMSKAADSRTGKDLEDFIQTKGKELAERVEHFAAAEKVSEQDNTKIRAGDKENPESTRLLTSSPYYQVWKEVVDEWYVTPELRGKIVTQLVSGPEDRLRDDVVAMLFAGLNAHSHGIDDLVQCHKLLSDDLKSLHLESETVQRWKNYRELSGMVCALSGGDRLLACIARRRYLRYIEDRLNSMRKDITPQETAKIESFLQRENQQLTADWPKADWKPLFEELE